ncbi:MAG: hypothetical protein N3B01_11370, partial [Verrucomicrobiae bacterium]|nr:hypothetical protein [Verrucomicrobiae bacterium]
MLEIFVKNRDYKQPSSFVIFAEGDAMGCLSQGQHRRSVWRWMGLCFAAGVLFFGVAGISSAADGISVYYVAPNGNGGGVSPCYATIQAAVNAADEPGDLIKVAAGTYLACNNEGGTSQCVRLIKTVTLRGGYTTSNWTVSNPAANPTVIDARGRGRCIFIQGSGIAPTVEGFEIRGGTANSAPVGKGGGVFVLESAATLRRNRITSNTATASSGAEGGGIYMENSNGVVEDNLIDLNRTNNAGGGCRVYRGAPRLDRNRFIQNSAYWGGGCSVDIANNTTFRNCVFAKNTAQYGGGLGVYDCKVQAWHCTFSENRAPTGGGLLQWAQDLNFAATNMIFANHPEVAIRVIRGSVTLNGVLWFNNATNTQGDVTVSHERTGDPAFVAPASNDYHIGAGSAALDAGVALVDGVILPVEDDVDRQLRPMRFGYDLGADEFPGVGLRLTKNPAQQILNRDYPCTYTIAVANLSTGTATGVVLTDTLDVWQRPKSVQATHGSVSTTTPTWGGGVIWNLGTMTPTAAATMTLVVDIATTTPAGQQILNTAQLVAAETTRMVPAANVVQTVRARVNNNPTEYLSIQAAVDAARAGDTVRVTGSGFGVLQRGGYRQQVYVNKNLTIQGGWNRTFTVRNPALYPTVVDAIGRGRCFYIAPRVTATLESLQLRNGDAEDLGGYTTAEVRDGGGCIYGS